MLDKGTWQQVLDSEEAKAIRLGAERAYSRRRQSKSGAAPAWSTAVVVQDVKEFGCPNLGSSSLIPSLDRTWSNDMQTLRDCDYNPDFRHMQTFLEVIFPLQWGFFYLHQQPSRQWMFDAILSSQPMYHASLGLSVTFESGLKAGYTNGYCDVTTEVRTSRLHALRGLQPCIAEMQQKRLDKSCLSKAIHAIGAILLLTSLEIYTETEGAWEIHQHATGTVLDLLETQIASFSVTCGVIEPIGSIGQLLRSSTASFETRALELFVTTYAWADILAEASLGVTYTRARKLDYLALLQQDVIEMRSIMGCDNAVMIAIKHVSIFAASMSTEEQAKQAESPQSLGRRIQDLIDKAALKFSRSTSGLDKDSNWVTLIHAYATLIYLQTQLLHRGLTNAISLEVPVAKCLRLLETMSHHLLIRVCWPFTVAGCMASEGNHPRFRAIVKRVEEAGHVLGFTWKGLIVMEECWRLRRSRPESIWCWRTTMEEMKVRILLI